MQSGIKRSLTQVFRYDLLQPDHDLTAGISSSRNLNLDCNPIIIFHSHFHWSFWRGPRWKTSRKPIGKVCCIWITLETGYITNTKLFSAACFLWFTLILHAISQLLLPWSTYQWEKQQWHRNWVHHTSELKLIFMWNYTTHVQWCTILREDNSFIKSHWINSLTHTKSNNWQTRIELTSHIIWYALRVNRFGSKTNTQCRSPFVHSQIK